jgi:hypothetical protein
MDPRVGLDDFGEEKNFFPLMGFDPGTVQLVT